MVLSSHPVLHIGLAESNALASLHMHSNISHASTTEMQAQQKGVTIHINNERCQVQGQVTQVGAVSC